MKQRTDDPSKLLVNFHDRAGNPWLWHRTDARDVVHGILQALDEDGAIDQTLNMHGPVCYSVQRSDPCAQRFARPAGAGLGGPGVLAVLGGQ